MAARSEKVSMTEEEATAKSKPPLDSMEKAKAAADWAVFFSGKVDDVRRALVNNKDALTAVSKTMGGLLTGLTAVPYVGIAAQLTKSLLEHVDKASAVQTLVDTTMVETLRWFEEQDLDSTLGSVSRSAGSLQELKKTMVEAALLAETIKGKGWGNRFFLAAPYEAKLKGKLESLREVRTKLGVEATWATTEMAAQILALLQSTRPEAITAQHNVPEVHPLFEGREDLLGKVHATFWPTEGTSRGPQRIVCLWGMRGIGKTQLARKYCHDNLGRYGRVLWVDVQGKGAQGGYADLGGHVLGLTRAPGEQLEDYVKRVKLTVQNFTEPFLMVFDGANGVNVLEEVDTLLPGRKQACHVLVTTTDDWALQQHGAVSLMVESLGEGHARLLLRKGLAAGAESPGAETEKKLDELARRLGYLTIALAGAVPLLKERRLEMDPVGKLLEELGRLGGVRPVNNLFELSLRSLGQLRNGEDGPEVVCRLATSIVMVAGWFGEGPVGTKFLLESAIRYHKKTHGATDESDLHDETVTRRALLRVSHYLPARLAAGAGGQAQGADAPNQGNVTLTCHVLLLEFVRRQGGAAIARAATLAATAGGKCGQETVQQFKGVWDVAVLDMDAMDSTSLTNLQELGFMCANYLKGVGGDFITARTVLETGTKKFGDGPRGWEWRLNFARALELVGQYDHAGAVAKAVVEELKARVAHVGVHERHPKSSTWLCCFGQQDGNLEAEEHTIRTGSRESSEVAKASPELASAWDVQALIHTQQGNAAEALRLYRQSLSVKERQLESDDPALAPPLHNMALLLESQGDTEEAIRVCQRSLRIWEKAFGPNDANVATALNSLATMLGRQGKYEEALPLFERSLRIGEKALHPDHPDAAIGLINMATMLERRGNLVKLEEVMPMYQRALEVLEGALGPGHPKVATLLNNMAGLLIRRREYDEALPLYEQTLRIQEKALGPDHPDVATTLNNMGNLFYDQGKFERALPLTERAIAILEKALGPEHPRTKIFGTGLSNIKRKLEVAATTARSSNP